jgi:hypothetical protein
MPKSHGRTRLLLSNLAVGLVEPGAKVTEHRRLVGLNDGFKGGPVALNGSLDEILFDHEAHP